LPQLESYIDEHRPIVFVGPYEHHSNEIMWRQGLCDVVEIPMDAAGELDLKALEATITHEKYEGRVKIGSFSAASNVTGILTDVESVAKIVHASGGIACFDFAACAPYVEINMSPADDGYLDAIVFSPHKFLGGPGSSGVLVFNEKIYQSDLPPSVAGGGTVAYVTSREEMFLDDIEERELAGTPGILQTIRVALAMEVKEKVGSDSIERIEKYYLEKMLARFKGNPGIEIYGPEDPEKRINIIPFNIKHLDRVLHPKFVTRLFSDLFGIQTRAGCSCAGPYGHRVLGISDEHSQSLIQHLQKSNLYGLKPGWVRLNLHYAFSVEEIDYLLDTIEFIIEHGALFLNDYDFDYLTGEWIPSGYKEPIIELSLDKIDSIGLKVSDDKQAGTPGLFAKQLQYASELAEAREQSTCYENLEMPLEQFMFFYSKTSINKP
jgi:selenocysteine lyase/cysteine desulfurase